MLSIYRLARLLPAAVILLVTRSAQSQSFQIQCPETTPYPSRPITANGVTIPGGRTKCQQISGGDGFATMADGTQTYLFAFGPLSGMADIVKGLPGTKERPTFMQDNSGRPDVVIGAPTPDYSFNGAVGLIPDGGETAGGPLNGHVDPRLIMDVGTLNGSQPAPMMAIDEDDEFFLTLTNVGQVMRPDLFEQHTVHFHGYPNASAFYDGVPDASIAINIGGSFTYYYLAPDAGTYFWHCHITPPEHLQMGMVGQIYVRPRQNRLTPGTNLYAGLAAMQTSNRTKCDAADVLCSHSLPPSNNGAAHQAGGTYAYNDGDGSTRYDVEYPIQLHGFDPNFHFVGMTFNPESFTDLKDKYFLINGRSYPDTVGGYACTSGGDPLPACAGKSAGDVVPGPMRTQGPDGVERTSQPQATVINIPSGGRALLRISELNITEMHTLGTIGVPMTVIGWNAKLLRDQDGNNMSYQTNSITLGGGESADVILDACQVRAVDGACTTVGYTAGQKFYLYSPKLDHLSNDAENFGGMMTEINICDSVDRDTKLCAIGSTVAGNF
jgi:FtsP/CotA-like multicopper oxidase with cupredoxin domain